MTEFESLGKTKNEPQDHIETFDIDFSLDRVSFSTKEFQCNCPVTGQPDIYRLDIVYGPRTKCIESKSLKLWLWSFRDQKKFAESLANEIAVYLKAVLDPFWISVELTQNVRGGLELFVSKEL